MGLMDFFTGRAPAPFAAPDPAIAREQMLASLLVMAWVVEARDPYTAGHLWRVSRYSALLCERSGMAIQQCARIAIGGFLHDLGKIGIPDAILRKADKLTDAEYAVIKTHPKVGARMLAGHPVGDLVGDAILRHHETPDGRGYPGGIAGADIPVSARIVGLSDAFDAMTSTRSYRVRLPVKHALEVIESQLGRQFDDTLGRHFLALGQEGLLDHIAGHSDDGIALQNCLMCDSTLVIRREQSAGDALFCRNCGGGYRLDGGHEDVVLKAVPTGARGTASDLQPVADTELIQRFLRDTARDAFAADPSGQCPPF